jgi:hypothetical protein
MEAIEAEELKQPTVKRRFAVYLRRTLPPGAFKVVRAVVLRLRFWWWCLSFYFPRLVTSRFDKRQPQVRSFGVPQASSHLAKELESLNMLAPTKTCRVMTKNGSDKGRPNNYTPVYSELFKDRRDQPLRIFELGLGSDNPDTPSNMGVFGVPGASHRGWQELFPRALVFGADIDRGILFQEGRIKTFYCDQLDKQSIAELWSQPDLAGSMDIIIEDGLHTFEGNISFLEGSLDRLRPGGIYVIEDIGWKSIDKWYARLETVYAKQYPTHEFAFVVLADRGYNNLLVIRRSSN